MSVLGKYRKKEEKETEKGEAEKEETKDDRESVPNSERKSPIVSFSIGADLRSCLQAVREENAINLSMWVDQQLRQAVSDKFPKIAGQHLKS
ncbi:MAG: hypothetical protein GF309_12940 [Candidatus Lokiarchaeota archaeon]|nr:hypothetical protein [Candidatus Lokiarchaeota archaeon]